jgi:DNA invertase Pin-like site-specific DNA recombinase
MSKTAVAYYRTSSATNVGSDKDSLKRQGDAVHSYAKANGIEIVREFYDAAVSGADPIDTREGFSDLLAYVSGNGARTILVENASRFARDLTVQLTGHSMLKELGYDLVPVDAPTHFLDDTPTATMIRSILGAVSQFEKAQLVSKLKAARVRKRKETGKCEGRKSWSELNPDLVREARRLRRKNPVSGKRKSFGKVATELAELGYLNSRGNQFDPSSIKRLIEAR